MSKSKILMILVILTIMMTQLLVIIFILKADEINHELMKSMCLGLLVIADIAMLITLIYDYAYIQISKKKHGIIKYVLKRKNKKTQVIGFFLLLSIFIIFSFILISIKKSLGFTDISALFLVSSLVLQFGYHNLEKEGLGDSCIYYWGTPVKWNDIIDYKVYDNVLTVVFIKKVFWMKEKYKIPFIIDTEQKDEILKFVSAKLNS